jgi:biopolymer transport protein ExbD
MRIPRAAAEEEAAMGLTPLVDVVFLLLIFFLVATSFDEPRLAIELPDAETAAAPDTRETVRVELRATGELRVDGRPIPLSALDRVLGERAATAEGLELRADREVPHGSVVEVLDRARAHDIRQISIAVEARAPAP